MKFSLTLLAALTQVFGQFVTNLACNSNVQSCSSSATDRCCSPDLGLLVLALQWDTGLGPKDAFTIHGLWPNNCDGSYGPSDGCDASRNYDDIDAIVSKDPSLENQMNTYWGSYKGDNVAFWEHEWNKHGTCYSPYEPNCYPSFERGQDTRDYFKTALALRNQFDLYNVLKNSGIIPGRTYARTDFIAALNKLGGQVMLSCKSGSISEIKIYMRVSGSSNFQITNAPSAGSCPKQINYPKKI